MNLDFFTVASNLVSLFALIAVGYFAMRLGLLEENSSAAFTALLMKITLPCTIFVSLVQREYDPAFLRDGLIIIAAGIIIFGGLMYLSRYVAILLRVPKNCRGVWAFTASYTNSGFMGFPIALALFGGEGLALAVMLNIAFNLTIYTIGPLEVARDNPARESEKFNIMSIIFSNINFATVVSLIFYFGKIRIPDSILMPLNYISGITTPLSMIMIGIALAHSKASELFTDIHAWTNSIVALLVYPAAITLFLKFFPLSSNPLVDAVIVLVIAMPAASVTTVICQQYHGNMTFAAKVMFIQNLFCVFTIPLICMML